MNHPRISTSPLVVAADTAAEALLYVPRFVLRVFGIKRSDRRRQPCVAEPGP
jgi:hypothetical protein